MQFATTQAEEIRRRTKTKDLEVDLWLSRKGIPKVLKELIMRTVERRIEENKEVQVENILTFTSCETQQLYQTLYAVGYTQESK